MQEWLNVAPPGPTTALLAGRVVGADAGQQACAAQLRDTRDGERRDDFDIRRQMVDRRRPAGAKFGHRKLAGVPKAEVAGLSNEKVTETSGTRLPSSEPI